MVAQYAPPPAIGQDILITKTKKQMKRRDALKTMSAAAAGLYLSNIFAQGQWLGTPFQPEISGPFKPTWESLMKYQVPDWFRDAKFGMWAIGGRSANRKQATGMPGECIWKIPGSTSIILNITGTRRK